MSGRGRIAGPVLGLALAACSAPASWVKPGVDEATAARDTSECRAQANRVFATNRAIDEDILASRERDWQRAGTLEPHIRQMREQASADAEMVFAGCMRAKGYSPQIKAG